MMRGCLHLGTRTLSKNSLWKSVRTLTVLGIETSCDDTAFGIVRSNGETRVVGEKCISQLSAHVRFGGILPPVAQGFHRANIETAMQNCIHNSGISIADIDAIAVTNRPGLPMSLPIGVRYAKHLCKKYSKPLIPVHHMQAHALMVRYSDNIEFPFICLLISGGHCQLVFVKDVDNFLLLGETIDDAPGEAFDKFSRRLKLHHLPEYANLSGGQAIELAARNSVHYKNSYKLSYPLPLARYRDCQFSFAGLKNNFQHTLKNIEVENGTKPDEVIESHKELCHSFLVAVTRHLCHRLNRGILYCLQEGLLSNVNDRSIVIAGGVAANDFIFKSCSQLGSYYGFKTFRALKHLCPDNGIMIAWNGIEKIRKSENCFQRLEDVNVHAKSSIGISLIEHVKKANIKCTCPPIMALRSAGNYK